jgi:hypothetical protein
MEPLFLSKCVQWYPPETVDSAVKVAYFLSQYGGSMEFVSLLILQNLVLGRLRHFLNDAMSLRGGIFVYMCPMVPIGIYRLWCQIWCQVLTS